MRILRKKEREREREGGHLGDSELLLEGRPAPRVVLGRAQLAQARRVRALGRRRRSSLAGDLGRGRGAPARARLRSGGGWGEGEEGRHIQPKHHHVTTQMILYAVLPWPHHVKIYLCI